MPPKTQYVFKIIVVGDGAVGKTSLILRFTEKKFSEEYKKTLGTDFAVKKIELKDSIIKLQIWDLGGQEIFRNLRKVFYPGAKAALIVYDMTNVKSFENIENWYNDIRKEVKDIPIIIVGNKTDLPRLISPEEAKMLSEKLNCKYIETSAKLDKNVDLAFHDIAYQTINSWKEKTETKIIKEEKPEKEPAKFEFKIPRSPTLIPPKVKIEMPEIFEKPKSPPLSVTKFYDWFSSNKKKLEMTVEDLLALTINLEKALQAGSLKEIINFFVEHSITFDYSPDKAGLSAWYGSGSPALSIVVDFTKKIDIKIKQTLLITTLLLLYVLIKSKTDLGGRIYIHFLIDETDEKKVNVNNFIEMISNNSDYILYLSNKEIFNVGIIPRIINTIKITIEKQNSNSFNYYQINNFLIRLLAHLIEPKLRVFYDIKLPVSKINLRSIELAEKNTDNAVSILEFQMRPKESSSTIINTLEGAKNRLVEEEADIQVKIEEVKSDLSPFIEEESPLLLALRDIIYFNLGKIIKIENETEDESVMRIAKTGKPLITCGALLKQPEIFQFEFFEEILIPVKILAGIIIDTTSRGRADTY